MARNSVMKAKVVQPSSYYRCTGGGGKITQVNPGNQETGTAKKIASASQVNTGAECSALPKAPSRQTGKG